MRKLIESIFIKLYVSLTAKGAVVTVENSTAFFDVTLTKWNKFGIIAYTKSDPQIATSIDVGYNWQVLHHRRGQRSIAKIFEPKMSLYIDKLWHNWLLNNSYHLTCEYID